MTRKARILLADDHALVREALRRAIESEPDMEVVGEAENVAATIDQVSAARPDLLLLDVTMPGGGGIAALREIRKAGLPTRTLVLTMHEDPEYLRVSLISGASGFILKHAAGREVVTAIRAVLQGRMYVDPTLAGVTLNEVLRPPHPMQSRPETSREAVSSVQTARPRKACNTVSSGCWRAAMLALPGKRKTFGMIRRSRLKRGWLRRTRLRRR